jgi:hypothetical protein
MFDIDRLRLDIETLLREFPELSQDDDLRADMLDAETDIMGALTKLLRGVDHDRTMIAAVAARVSELTARKARFAHRVEVFRGLILKVMQSADLKKVELPDATLSQRAGQPQIVGEPDIETLPDEFIRVTREADRGAIRRALLDHREVSGLALSNAAPILAINVK